jgi:cytoskeletal protein CcmA (bactofilin family)
MFGKQEESSGQARSQSLIQEGVSVKGEIRAEGDVRIEGSLEGNLTTKARVIIGATGVIHADIEAGEVLVMGRLSGKIVGHKRIELRKGAHVEGEIATQALVIEEGVFFQGLAQMNVPGSGSAPAKDKDRGRSQSDETRRPPEQRLFTSTTSTSGPSN